MMPEKNSKVGPKSNLAGHEKSALHRDGKAPKEKERTVYPIWGE